MTYESNYGKNKFLSLTKDSDEKAILAINEHVARLKKRLELEPQEADFTKMYNRTFPLRDGAQLIYDHLFCVQGTQVGQTELVNIHLKLIKGKMGLAHDWQTRTAAIYAKDFPARMKAIWSTGLKPFNGKMDKVISALNTLSMNIGADANPLMVAIKAEVDAEYGIINPERAAQIGDKSATKFTRKSLHAACKLCMKMEYRNQGLLQDKFEDNIDNIQESFHDWELLLSKQQISWNIGLKSLETKDIAKRTQLSQGKFRAMATGGDAIMYLASTPGGIDSDFVVLTDGVENKFTAAAFKVTDYGINCHITVVNSANNPIRFNLDLG